MWSVCGISNTLKTLWIHHASMLTWQTQLFLGRLAIMLLLLHDSSVMHTWLRTPSTNRHMCSTAADPSAGSCCLVPPCLLPYLYLLQGAPAAPVIVCDSGSQPGVSHGGAV